MASKDQTTVRMSPEEKREIERRAEAADRSMSRFMVESALSEGNDMMSSEEREELMEELRQLYREIRSIGGNINQIARRLNKRKSVSENAIKKAAKAAEQAGDAIIGMMDEIT